MLVHFHFINLARRSLLLAVDFVRLSPFGLIEIKLFFFYFLSSIFFSE
jgi:hypothetical protein